MPQHAQERRTVKATRSAKLAEASRRNITTIRENVPVMALAGIAFGASYGHISKLCGEYGPRGWVQYATAGCVDLLCIVAAEERQRDRRIERTRIGRWVSWPTLVLVIGIALTLVANIATAQKDALGYFVAALPAGALLLAVSVLERRVSHTAVPKASGTRMTARKQPQESGTGTAAPVPAETAAVPQRAAMAAAGGGAEDDAARAWTDDELVTEARRLWAEHAAMGAKLTQSRFELALKNSERGGAGRPRVIEALKTVRAEAESAARDEAPGASEAAV